MFENKTGRSLHFKFINVSIESILVSGKSHTSLKIVIFKDVTPCRVFAENLRE